MAFNEAPLDLLKSKWHKNSELGLPELSTFIFSEDFIQKVEIFHIQNILKEHNRLVSDFKSKESKIHGLEEVDDKVKACRAV